MHGSGGWLTGLVLWFATGAVFAEDVAIGERFELHSERLDETRAYQVHLPAEYGARPGARYPVLYLLDGDYNFHYVTGLVEQLSTMSQRIPPVIVVGVSDLGPDSYRGYMTETPGGGEKPIFARFLIEELRPAIESRYRTAPQALLAGHSIGGMFTLSTLLAAPEAFQAFIAVSPALWGDDFAFVDRAAKRLQSGDALPAHLYLSLADEKDMGVYSFIGDLERHPAPDLAWEFKRFAGENHDSVGLPAIRHALLRYFDGYEMDRARFDAMGTDPDKLLAAYRALAERLGYEPVLPNAIGKIIGFYAARERFGDIDTLAAGVEKHFPASFPTVASQAVLAHHRAGHAGRSRTMLTSLLERHPRSVAAHEAAATIRAGNEPVARRHRERAVTLASEQELPRWRLNQLEAAVR